MIVENWTHHFAEQWNLAKVTRPLELELLNQLIHESLRVHGTSYVMRGGEPWKILSIYVHFDLGMIFKIDEIEKVAVALIYRKAMGRIWRTLKSERGMEL
jgi:hypothetical protein